jgi:outer membrane protein OmpA-like peptidoglycan-associated protein/tetratricopeptide (TPR) repeat protein
MKKFLLLYTLCITLSGSLIAQSTNISTAFHNNIKKADIYFNHFAYRNALNLYLHALEGDPKNVYVRDRIADCYFKLHDPVNAEVYYESIINEPAIHPTAIFEYAEVLSMNGKYRDSKHWFEQYLKKHPDSETTKDKIAFLNDIDYYAKDSLRFVVTGVDFNTEHSEYGVHYFHDGLVFASSRDVDYFFKHKPFDAVDYEESLLNMYYVPGKAHGEHGEVEHLHREHIKTVLHEGPMAFFKNDTRAAYTRTNIRNGRPVYDKEGRAHLQIYFADVNTLSSMSNITPFKYNNDNYSVAHPSLSPDGSIMFFSSTAPGGYGRSDIYYTTFDNGNWSDPVNAGNEINTEGDESFPFLANDSTLYFSSDGHGSLGGLDILVSYKRKGKWSRPLNFGGPLNSRFDDFSMVCNESGRYGYFASNRPGGLGLDDIYYFIATYYFLTGKVIAYDKTGNPLDGVNIYAFDEKTGQVIDSATTDINGRFHLNLPFDKDYKIVIKKDGYDEAANVPFNTHGRPMGLDSLNVALWKRELFAKGKIYSNETQQPLPGATVMIFNETDKTEESVNLHDLSEYSILLRPDKKYRLQFGKPGYLTKNLNINTDGIFKGELLNDIVLEEEFVNKAVIHFAYNKSTITDVSIDLMKPIVATLKKVPSATLNIGAHADSRGGFPYNQRLSEERARNTVKYFVSQGIARKRIEWKGFGEKLLLNQCSDGVVCSEEEHSINRRAEIKVQMD